MGKDSGQELLYAITPASLETHLGAMILEESHTADSSYAATQYGWYNKEGELKVKMGH